MTATGYNSYHELMLGYDGPVVFAPTNQDRLDDQVARAEYAGEQGWASVVDVENIESQSGIIEDFMRNVRSGNKVTSRPRGDFETREIAELINQVAMRYR